ncbi:hypothetical protein ACLOJK_036711, partial [Asimina triloba]
MPTAHSLGSFSHINLPLPTISDLSFSGGGVDDLNIDNVDRPLRLLAPSSPWLLLDVLKDLPHLFIEQALATRERDLCVVEYLFWWRNWSAAESVALAEGRAIEAVVLDSDDGSGSNSSVGQHVPTGGDRWITVSEGPFRREGFRGSCSGLAPPLDINVEFVEPFR